MKYYITRDIVSAQGWQMFSTEADSKEEALKNFLNGDDEFEDEGIEITSVQSCLIENINDHP